MNWREMNPRLIASLVLTGLIVLFVVQNAALVQVQFLLWTVELSRALLIFVVLAVGIIVGWLMRGHVTSVARERENP